MSKPVPVVLVGDLSADEANAARQVGCLAEKVRSRLSAPYRLTITRPGQADTVIEHRRTASLGVVLFNGTDDTAEDILCCVGPHSGPYAGAWSAALTNRPSPTGTMNKAAGNPENLRVKYNDEDTSGQ